ncbi:hypothetical protein GCM10010260_38020 [Streptomyces filipinensis]|uniref:Uncharacterized protein n=1 Tax=Streptomyces filipinensis TaxID=66887 RepID=A0A918MCB7_9ACTN|nr:hypothetical protein [Streptomyces filipinensis]GGU98222.1 hypothetical protein GCM10010260_38020 [Streptomyces filipinensis]
MSGAPVALGAGGRYRAGGGWGGDQNGWSKMFGASLASQTGRLYPTGALACVCGLLWRRGTPRTDRPRAGFLLWSTWLATYFLVFSAGSVAGRTYYMGVIAVPRAALTGGGVAVMWRAHRAGGRGAWALPGAVAATAAWSAYVADGFPAFLPWPAPVARLLGLTAGVLGGSGARPLVPGLRDGRRRPVRHEPRSRSGDLGGRPDRAGVLG